MNIAAEIATVLSQFDGLWLPALDALLKVTFVLGLAGLATLVLGRASAALRHLVWTLALTSALVLPLLSIALPRWQLPLVTLTGDAPVAVADAPVAPAPALNSRARTAEVSARTTTPTTPLAASPAAAVRPRISLTMALVSIWAAGVVVVIARLLVGMVAVGVMARRTVPVVSAPWLPLAVDLAAALGISRRVTFLESARASMPMASGVFAPSVLMPEDANRWPLERLRIVLLHELAHVKRRDCLTHVIAQLACALHWFNPLAWVAARRIRTERERACDDLVLACGTPGPDYAEELLEIARVMRGGRYPALLSGATLAMAHRSQLEGRLIAILDPKVPRSGVSRLRTALAAAAVACALPPLAAMQPWAVVAAEASADDLSREWSQAAEALSPTLEAQATPASTPRPEPQPQPRPMPSPAEGISGAIGPAVSAAIAEAMHTAAPVVAQETQAAVQSVIQGGIQGALNGAVLGALQGLDGGHSGQSGQRAAADPRMIAALTAALKDTDKEVRETAMHALVQMRDPAIFEPLVQALKDTSPDVREEAARGLSQLRDKRAVEPLIAALKDLSADVREGVVHALSQLRDPRAVDPLVAALKDESASVREQSAFALGQLRDPRAVDALIAALKDANADVRQQAVFALGQLRDKRASAAIAGLVKDPDEDVREQAVFALGQIRDVSAIDGLVAALRDTKPDVRQQAAFALGQIRDARAVPPLMSALKDDAADVREQAAFALGQIRDRSAVEALAIAMKDPSPDVREQVAFALGQIRDPRAIDALTNALKDASADVRQKAAFALGQIAR